jgi:1-acyl-sn-glycerol-3-phosphate acyltransferase
MQQPEARRARSGPGYDTDWARRLPARVSRAALRGTVMRAAVAALAAPERRGLDRLERWRDADTPLIFAANHHSHLDTPLLLTSIPDPWRDQVFVGAAADYFFRTRLTSAASALAIGAIPIERTRVSRSSADRAAELLDDGWSMLIFPEGGRSKDGWGQPFRGGAAYLALRCGVPVVPVHVEGSRHILRKGKTLPSPATVTVTFGEPLRAEAGEGDSRGEPARRLAARIEHEVAALADEAATDWWSARRRAHAGTTPPLTGPDAQGWRRSWALGDPSRKRRRETRRWPKV